MQTGPVARLRLLAWCAGLAGAVAVLHAARGVLPLTDLGHRPPLDATFAVLRVGAMAVAAYLLVVTVLAVAGELAPLAPLGRLAPASVRTLVSAGLGVSLLVAVPAGAQPTAPPTMHRVVDEPAPAAPPPAEPGWVVAPGDHLWSVAERTLAERLGRAPTHAEVVPYWCTLVDANRSRLADPSNPDLIFPGQTVVLP